jgi:hypothetical protein
MAFSRQFAQAVWVSANLIQNRFVVADPRRTVRTVGNLRNRPHGWGWSPGLARMCNRTIASFARSHAESRLSDSLYRWAVYSRTGASPVLPMASRGCVALEARERREETLPG